MQNQIQLLNYNMTKKLKKQIKLLMIEDDADQVLLYSSKFLIEGIDVSTADTEESAMKYLSNNQFDIILLDILLNDENGLNILKNFKQNEKIKNIPVVMFSNYFNRDIRDKAKKLGAIDFIMKSEVLPKHVVAKIIEVVENNKKI